MYFEDKYLKCPECGSEMLYKKEVFRYKKDKKLGFVKEFMHNEILCNKCNTLVLKEENNF